MTQSISVGNGASPLPEAADTHPHAGFWTLAIGSIGVVYGDIGTSPLYAFRESILAATGGGAAASEPVVLGILSLIIWALVFIVTVKYVIVLLRADNKGEGGTLALMALASRALGRASGAIILLGIISGALFYGDAIITPALSVLSAVEGLKVIAPHFDEFVVPLTVVILIALFWVQSHGTARVATFFGPIMMVWFAAIAAGGLWHIGQHPAVLFAFNPWHGISFLLHHGIVAFFTLGAVFLVVTGAEALYADLGHFGRAPIRLAWLVIVLPALLLNYLGQGALVLAEPKALDNPFFLLFPQWALLPMVVLATIATVIASQAVITGAYSLTRQAIQLGLLPRLEIRHTSEALAGQIFMPRVNALLLIGVLLLVLLFGSSSALASAYGIAVATTMVMDGVLGFIVVWKLWRWKLWEALALIIPFFVVDVTFFSANLLKLLEGAWLPILFGISMVLIILTWRRGTTLLINKTRRTEVPLDTLFRNLEKKPPHIVPGTAVFLTSDPAFSPAALLHNLKHNKVLHEHNVILTIMTADTPRVPEGERVKITPLSEHFTRLSLKFGYMEQPNVPKALAIARKHGWQFDIMSTSFFLSRRTLRPSPQSGMPSWQDHLFIALARSAADATDFFQIPTGRVVEVGTQVTV